MSLEWGRFRMLGIDRQHAGKRKTKPGANPGVSGGQRWRAVRGREPGAAVWLGGSNPAGARLRTPGTPGQRAGAIPEDATCTDRDRRAPPAGPATAARLPAGDTVHQGDLDGVKGVYHINAVDELTQWQVVGATAQISEAWLMPVLEAMLAQF